MIERLGHLIFLVACGLAAAVMLAGVISSFFGDLGNGGGIIRAVLLAVLIYLIGRALRYALTGKR